MADNISAFRAVPRTGVIFVTTEAVRRGFHSGHPDWCNLGQGMPETGPLPGAPPRVNALTIALGDQEYAPVAGLPELRDAVAQMYNRLYRRGMRSQYSAENVAISSGGRAALTRAAASIGQVNLGHFLPDYTAYEELLDIFKAFTAIPILLERERGYAFTPEDLQREIMGRGLSALLVSNPCNPSGKLIGGEELSGWVAACRKLDCSLIIDEFYSHYIYDSPADQLPIESAARYVEDVDSDPVVILDGLTKNWRYPGWRVAWTVGPKSVIEAVSSAGSFLDGGGSRMLQRKAIELLEYDHVVAETKAISSAFSKKRELMLQRLGALGIRCDLAPQGTFYLWGDLSALPESINDGMKFFRTLLDHKVIAVPGMFFDVNPGKRRNVEHSRFRNYARFSFGPSYDNLVEACDRLDKVVAAAD